jgi:hypothetical protein
MPQSLEEIFNDPVLFISRLSITDKEGKICLLTPTPEQIEMIGALQTGRDCLFLKPRQIGASTIVSAYYFWKWYTSKEPITIAILSHKMMSAKHLLHMYKFFYSKLPNQLRRPLIVENTTELILRDSGAKIMAVSGEASGGLRSFTCNALHISEYAFTPQPEELKATAIAALNGNQLVIESTANAYGDSFHQEVIQANRGEGNWEFRFFGWNGHAGYKQDYPSTYVPTDMDYCHKHELSYGQMYWRDNMIARLGTAKFMREYPLELKDAFAQSGDSYFTDEDLRYMEVVNIDPGNNKFTKLINCDKDAAYAIGVDVASGRGGDYSVIMVLDKQTYKPAAIFRSKTTSPVELAERIHRIAVEYNEALILIEENNWGLPVLNEMRHRGYYKLWKDDKDRDWNTNKKTKITMFEELKALLYEGILTQVDSITYTELRSYQLDKKGLAPVVPDNLDHHGDCVIALALACQCLKKVRLSSKSFLPDFIKKRRADKIIRESLGMAERRET